MKKVKLIIMWILLSLVIQCGLLFMLNNSYFKDNTNVTMKQIDINSMANEKTIHIKIPSDAKNLEVSFDGVYVTYQENGKYMIGDTSTGNIQALSNREDPILSAGWLDGRDMLLNLQVNDGQVVLYSYDAQTGNNRKLVTICPYAQSLVNFEIKASTITGVTYVKVNNTIFRININQTEADPIYPAVNQLGSMAVMPTEDRLVYVAQGGSILHLNHPQQKIEVNTSSSVTILGIDDNGIAYLGVMNNGEISKILTKNLSNGQSGKEYALKANVLPNDINVTESGNIYVNYGGHSEVEELNTSKVTNYKGTFIGFYQYGVSTVVDGKYYKQRYSEK